MINFVLSLITSGVIVGACYGVLSSKIITLEACAEIAKADHEKVLVINTKLDVIIEDLREIKIDLKELKGRR